MTDLNILASLLRPAAQPMGGQNMLARLLLDAPSPGADMPPTPGYTEARNPQPTRPGWREIVAETLDPNSRGNRIVMGFAANPATVNARGGAEAARMARAASQGYTIDAYKAMYPETGTSLVRRGGQWVEEGVRRPVTEFNNPSAPYAGFFSDSPAVANNFQRAFGSPSAIYPARLRFSNPLVIDAAGRPAAAFQFDDIARAHNSVDDMNRFRGAFNEGSRFDGVIIRNTADEGTVYVPRTPQQARSRFAQFAEGQENNPNMLASLLAPVVLSGAAAAGGGQ